MQVATNGNSLGLQCHKESGEGCSVVDNMCQAMNYCWGSLGTCLPNGRC